MNQTLTSEAQDAVFLGRLGERVRAWRNGQRMTRKALAEASGVSERDRKSTRLNSSHH